MPGLHLEVDDHSIHERIEEIRLTTMSAVDLLISIFIGELPYGGFHKWGICIPEMDGVLIDNPIKMDDLGVPPFQDTSIYISFVQLRFKRDPPSGASCSVCRSSEVWMFEEEVQHKGVKRKLSEVFNETKVVG